MVALLVVAVALGLNNFGAAIAIGVGGVDRRTEIKVATVFGLCGAGILFVTAVWGFIEVLRGDDDAPRIWHGWRLLVSGAALSLDDLAVGLALGTVRFNIVLAVTLFGLMSFIMSIIGLKLGGKLGTAAGEHGEVVGAIVLIGIAGAMAAGWLLSVRGRHLNELDHHDDDREDDVRAQRQQADPARHAERGPLERVDARGTPREAALPELPAPLGAAHPRRAPVAAGIIGRRPV